VVGERRLLAALTLKLYPGSSRAHRHFKNFFRLRVSRNE
jgi:hypothetical protein